MFLEYELAKTLCEVVVVLRYSLDFGPAHRIISPESGWTTSAMIPSESVKYAARGLLHDVASQRFYQRRTALIYSKFVGQYSNINDS